MLIIGITEHFDAAHSLPDYDGKCRNLHGHTWKVTVEVKGEIHKNGMVVDIVELKKIVREEISVVDHVMLNTYINNPTCENMVKYFADVLEQRFVGLGIKLKRLKIQEGEGGWCIWEK